MIRGLIWEAFLISYLQVRSRKGGGIKGHARVVPITLDQVIISHLVNLISDLFWFEIASSLRENFSNINYVCPGISGTRN